MICIFFGWGFISIQIKPVLDEFDLKFMLDLNTSIRFTKICLVILWISMRGVS